MIIQIRGTSGSGKSTVMRCILESLEWKSVYKKGRKQPLYYTSGSIAVLGHYESPCGGCDTIGSAKAVFDLVQELDYPIVLCEGLLLSEDVKWSIQLEDLRVVYLTTPLEQCIRQIEGRRREAGNQKPLNTENTSRRVAVIERSRIKLLERGVKCLRLSANQAPRVILKWLVESTR